MTVKVEHNHLCIDCVGDDYVKGRIKQEGSGETCSYCDNEGDCVDISVVCDWVDLVYRANYQPGDSYPVFPDGQEKPDWEMAGSYPEEIIDEMLLAKEGVAKDVVTALSDREGYAVAKDCETAYYDDTSCYEEAPVYDFQHSELWDSFCDQVKHRSRFFSTSAIELLKELFSDISELQHSDGQAPIRAIDLEGDERFIYRARSARADAERIRICVYPGRELGPPPKRKSIAGRMNPAGIPVFYGALKRKTCISELRLPVGEVAVSGKFEITKSLTVMDLPSLCRVYKELSLFDPNFESKASQFKFLRRFEDEVSRPILPGEELLEYIPTQALAEYLANYHEPKIDGLIYSSAQTNGTEKNIVLFSHVADVQQLIPHADEEGSRRFEVVWLPSQWSHSVFETEDSQKGIQIGGSPTINKTNELALRFVEDSLKVHRIKAVSPEYDSDSVSVRYKEDLSDMGF